MKSTEKATQHAVLEYLAMKRIFHWRNNSGATITQRGHFMRFGAVGSPDIFAIHNGVIYGFEIKDVKGKLSDSQKAFREGMNKAGGQYLVIRSIDDVIPLF